MLDSKIHHRKCGQGVGELCGSAGLRRPRSLLLRDGRPQNDCALKVEKPNRVANETQKGRQPDAAAKEALKEQALLRAKRKSVVEAELQKIAADGDDGDSVADPRDDAPAKPRADDQANARSRPRRGRPAVRSCGMKTHAKIGERLGLDRSRRRPRVVGTASTSSRTKRCSSSWRRNGTRWTCWRAK